MTKIINAAGKAFAEELTAWFGMTVEHVDVRTNQASWPTFEGQETHVVFYQRPEHLIVAAVEDGETLEKALEQALQALNVVLQQQKQNRRGYRLVDIDQARQQPKALMQALAPLGLECNTTQAQAHHHDPLLLVAHAAVQQNETLREQVELLEASSLPLSAADSNVLGVDLARVVVALKEDSQALQQAQATIGQLNNAQKEAKEENELLLLQLQQVQEELEANFLSKKQLDDEKHQREQQLKSLKAELQQAQSSLATLESENSELGKQIKTLSNESSKSTEAQTQLKELTEENELLLLQLQQVQEELEHYFIENKKLSQKLVAAESHEDIDREIKAKDAEVAKLTQKATQVTTKLEQLQTHANNLQQENTRILQQLLATQTELEKALNRQEDASKVAQAKADKEATVTALKADFRQQAEAFKAKADERVESLKADFRAQAEAFKAKTAEEMQALKTELEALRQKANTSVNSQEQDLLVRKYQSQIEVKNEKLHSFSQRRKEEKARYEAEIEALKATLAGYERQVAASQNVAEVSERQESIESTENTTSTENKQVTTQSDAPKSVLPVSRRAKRKLANMFGLRKAGPIKQSDPERELLDQQINLVENSSYFDRQWYLQTYPDVAEDVLKNDANPVEHYIRYGGFEARNPSPRFDSQFYLDSNPDVAEAEMNPLVHYLQYGKEESRQPLPTTVVTGS
ncbi:MAG: hypothetical protein LAT77_10660 [Aliidiomarina sp.]|uniref:hypothetical protein n=1 Tax=Aliidiomarina sp. TaxID=1872439 RepID=UPI0025C56AF7|nr:hypothetical protein [Aliidiomarina sp.]MCH8502356.1 hypothetical protein [Aliidiomarina sp.]